MSDDEALCYAITWDGVHYKAKCTCCATRCVAVADKPGIALRKAVAGCRLAYRERQAAKLNNWHILDLG